MTAIEPALKYPNISAQAFAHPADRAASAALRAVPMLDTVIKKLSELQSESRFRQLLLGNAVRLGEDQMPAAWAIQQRCASVLDIDRCPALYVTQQPVSQALTVGTHEPVTLVMSGLIADFEEDELTLIVIGGVLAWAQCVLELVHDAGDHEIVVGRVADLGTGEGSPLVYYRGSFVRLGDAVDLPAAAGQVAPIATDRALGPT